MIILKTKNIQLASRYCVQLQKEIIIITRMSILWNNNSNNFAYFWRFSLAQSPGMLARWLQLILRCWFNPSILHFLNTLCKCKIRCKTYTMVMVWRNWRKKYFEILPVWSWKNPWLRHSSTDGRFDTSVSTMLKEKQYEWCSCFTATGLAIENTAEIIIWTQLQQTLLTA